MERGIHGERYTWREVYMERGIHGERYTWREVNMKLGDILETHKLHWI